MVHRGIFADPHTLTTSHVDGGGGGAQPRRLLASTDHADHTHPTTTPSKEQHHIGSLGNGKHATSHGGGANRGNGSPQLPSSGLVELIGTGQTLLSSSDTPPLAAERTPDGSFEQTPPWSRRWHHQNQRIYHHHHRSNGTTPTTNGATPPLHHHQRLLLRPEEPAAVAFGGHHHDASTSGKITPSTAAAMSIEDIFAHATIVPAMPPSSAPHAAPPGLPRFPATHAMITPTNTHNHQQQQHQGRSCGHSVGANSGAHTGGVFASHSNNNNHVAHPRSNGHPHRHAHNHHHQNSVSAAFGRAAVKRMLERSDGGAVPQQHQRHQQVVEREQMHLPPRSAAKDGNPTFAASQVMSTASASASTTRGATVTDRRWASEGQTQQPMHAQRATSHSYDGHYDGQRKHHRGTHDVLHSVPGATAVVAECAVPVQYNADNDDDDVGMSEIAPLVALACQRIVAESELQRPPQPCCQQHPGEQQHQTAADGAGSKQCRDDACRSTPTVQEVGVGAVLGVGCHTTSCSSSVTPPSSFSRLGVMGRPPTSERQPLLTAAAVVMQAAMGASTSSFDSPSLRNRTETPTGAADPPSLPRSMRLLPGTSSSASRSPAVATTARAATTFPGKNTATAAPSPPSSSLGPPPLSEEAAAMEHLIRHVSKAVPYRGSGQLVVVASLIYLGRLSTKCPCARYHVSNDNWLRLATVCLLVATKMYLEEAPFRVNKSFAEITSIPLCELQKLEVLMLHLLDFSLVVQPSEVGQWCYWIHSLAERRGMQTSLYRFFETSVPTQQQQQQQQPLSLSAMGYGGSDAPTLLSPPAKLGTPSSFSEYHPLPTTTTPGAAVSSWSASCGRSGGGGYAADEPTDQLKTLLAQTAATANARPLPLDHHHHSRVDSWGGGSFSFVVDGGGGGSVISPLPGGSGTGFPPMLRLDETALRNGAMGPIRLMAGTPGSNSTSPADARFHMPVGGQRSACSPDASSVGGAPSVECVHGHGGCGRLFSSVFGNDDFLDDDDGRDDDIKPPTPPLADDSPMKRYQTQHDGHSMVRGGGRRSTADDDDDDDVMNVFSRITRAAAARTCLSPLSSAQRPPRQHLSPIGFDDGGGSGGGAARFLTSNSRRHNPSDTDDDVPRKLPHQRRLSPPA